jgi:hypothetical protein
MSYKAHKWDYIMRHFEEAPPTFKPMAALVRRICSSPYRDNLFPVQSHYSLSIFQTEEWKNLHEALQINYSVEDGRFHFEYAEHPNRKTKWKKECPVEEGYSAFIHFLKLKNWFPVTEAERGA